MCCCISFESEHSPDRFSWTSYSKVADEPQQLRCTPPGFDVVQVICPILKEEQ